MPPIPFPSFSLVSNPQKYLLIHSTKWNQVSILGASNGPFLFCGRSSARKDLLKLSTKPAQYIRSPPFKCGYSSPVAGVGIVNQLCGKYKGKSEQKSSTSVQHWIIHRLARAKSPGWDFLGTWNKASAAPGTLHNFVNYLDILVFYSNWVGPFQIIIWQGTSWTTNTLIGCASKFMLSLEFICVCDLIQFWKHIFSPVKGEFSHGQTLIRTAFCPTVPWSSGCEKI